MFCMGIKSLPWSAVENNNILQYITHLEIFMCGCSLLHANTQMSNVTHKHKRINLCTDNYAGVQVVEPAPTVTSISRSPPYYSSLLFTMEHILNNAATSIMQDAARWPLTQHMYSSTNCCGHHPWPTPEKTPNGFTHGFVEHNSVALIHVC